MFRASASLVFACLCAILHHIKPLRKQLHRSAGAGPNLLIEAFRVEYMFLVAVFQTAFLFVAS